MESLYWSNYGTQLSYIEYQVELRLGFNFNTQEIRDETTIESRNARYQRSWKTRMKSCSNFQFLGKKKQVIYEEIQKISKRNALYSFFNI